MRKRIPLRSSDVQTPQGRPGPLTRLAFLIKENWQGKAITSTEAKFKLGQAMGYRTFKEAQVSGETNSEAMPEPGSVTRAEIVDVVAWGLHRKGGLSFIDAMKVTSGLDLTTLAVDKATLEVIQQTQHAAWVDGKGSSFMLMDELHWLMNSPWPDQAPNIFAAGAPAYTYAVYGDCTALMWDRLQQCVADLPAQLITLLREEEMYSDLDTDENLLTSYLADEIIPNARVSVDAAVREHGLLPAGLRILWLFNREGEYRGRCLANDTIGGLQPSVHWDYSIYGDAIELLKGGIPRYTYSAPSREGAGKGQVLRGFGARHWLADSEDGLEEGVAQLINAGDEALFTLNWEPSSLIRDMAVLADSGQGDQIRVDPSQLRMIPGVVLTDMRFKEPMYPIEPEGDGLQVFDNGSFAPRSYKSHALCGSQMFDDHMYIRAQSWLTVDDAPLALSRFVVKDGKRTYPGREAVTAHQRGQDAILNSLLESTSKAAHAALGGANTLRFIPASVSGGSKSGVLASINRYVATRVERELDPDDDVDQLRALGRDVAAVRPDLVDLDETNLGWILLHACGEYLGSRGQSLIDSEVLEEEKGSAQFNAFMVAVALASYGELKTSHLPSGIECVLGVYALFDNVMQPGQLAEVAAEAKTFIDALSKQRTKIEAMDKWTATTLRRESFCQKEGYWSVGTPVKKPTDLRDYIREFSPKFPVQTTTVTQDIRDLKSPK